VGVYVVLVADMATNVPVPLLTVTPSIGIKPVLVPLAYAIPPRMSHTAVVLTVIELPVYLKILSVVPAVYAVTPAFLFHVISAGLPVEL